MEKVKELSWFHPKDPKIDLDPSINKGLLFDDLLGLYNAYRRPVKFEVNDLIEKYRSSEGARELLLSIEKNEDSLAIGSNNWVVSGEKMADGNTYMANDPHRTIAIPSLRYMAHLVAPGWDVIGGGEPEIPGISIGHNEYGTWGLTIFRTDGEDLYVYDLNPENLNQYRYKGEWENFEVINETIKVKGQDDQIVKLSYSRHGPVAYIDEANNTAYAVRCAWLEPGGSPYLASLRMDQAKTWEEFREACNYSHIPGENMIWADKKGNIGWQAVGIAPIRRNFSGMVPVPGDGSYEWDGYLPIVEKPNTFNPPKGFFATANQNVTPENYEHWDAIAFSWSDPYRGDRVNEILSGSDKLTMEDMKALQVDYYSNPAKILVPLLDNLQLDGDAAAARIRLKGWDNMLEPNSIAAAVYVAWENSLRELGDDRFIPENGRDVISGIQMKRLMDWITTPDKRFGNNPTEGRDQFLTEAFNNGIDFLKETLGENMDAWQYGQEKFKHTYIAHVLGDVAPDEIKSKLNVGPLPRGGNSYTPGSSGGNNRQSSGASFRIIVNTGDWDAALGTNGPGQSGNPKSEFYDNLFEPWANDEYFPVYYSKEKIESVTVEKIMLIPN